MIRNLKKERKKKKIGLNKVDFVNKVYLSLFLLNRNNISLISNCLPHCDWVGNVSKFCIRIVDVGYKRILICLMSENDQFFNHDCISV